MAQTPSIQPLFQSLGTAGPLDGAGVSLITSSMIDTLSRPAPAMIASTSDVAKNDVIITIDLSNLKFSEDILN